jgi:hypothetical protein
MAPPTRKGAALEEYCCADARAIVDSVFLDVKNESGLRHILTIQLKELAVNIQIVYNMYIKECFKDKACKKQSNPLPVKATASNQNCAV